MKWLEIVAVIIIFAVALWAALSGRKGRNRECADCPLIETCDKKNRKKTRK